ncbi:MAG: alcohol dehydrogenase catalytic domain-containing protein [Acidobacteriota bacterium]
MKTLLYPAYDTMEISEQPEPAPSSGQVLLRVEACGICGSEIEAFKKRSPRRVPPLVMGHEFCGVVEESGRDVKNLKPGDHVVSHSLISCGTCARCLRGQIHLCEHRQIFGMQSAGAFAEFVVAPERCLIAWPDGVPAEAACLTEPLANGVHVVNLTKRLEPKVVAVIGAGAIGLLCQQAFQTMIGAEVLVCDLIPERLQTASNLGARTTINSATDDVVEAIRELTGGEGADVVVDAVGGGITKKLALAATRFGGATVWIGTHENSITFDSYDITMGERQVLGSYAATMPELQFALDLIALGKVDAQTWTKQYPLEAGVLAFQTMLSAKGDDIKAVLRPH